MMKFDERTEEGIPPDANWKKAVTSALRAKYETFPLLSTVTLILDDVMRRSLWPQMRKLSQRNG